MEVLKKAEKENCIIVRAYETRGCPAGAILLLHNYYRVYDTGIMEQDDNPLQAEDRVVSLQFQPFEIRTFKLKKH